ncbi:hypothetical protein [Rhizobium sp. 21-4511-3d]
MAETKKQFLQFVALLALLGALAAAVAGAGLPSAYALPFFAIWAIAFLSGVGFIIDGGRGAKALVSRTALTWTLLVSVAALIAWLVAARFG